MLFLPVAHLKISSNEASGEELSSALYREVCKYARSLPRMPMDGRTTILDAVKAQGRVFAGTVRSMGIRSRATASAHLSLQPIPSVEVVLTIFSGDREFC